MIMNLEMAVSDEEKSVLRKSDGWNFFSAPVSRTPSQGFQGHKQSPFVKKDSSVTSQVGPKNHRLSQVSGLASWKSQWYMVVTKPTGQVE